jgi:hypothetical protein
MNFDEDSMGASQNYLPPPANNKIESKNIERV